MARHRSPRGQRPKPNLPTPASSRRTHRRRPAHRLPTPALGGAAVVGAVAAGAVAASGVATGQTVTLVSAPPDLPAEANALAAGTEAPADAVVTKPAAAPRRLELSTVALERDPADEVQALAKGVELAAERARPKPDDERSESSEACPSSGFNGVKPHVARAGYHLRQRFGVEDVGGVAKRPGNPSSDHPRGYALDFMVDRSTGDALAAYAEEHSEALGIKYILWRVANHYDHVHISFTKDPGSGLAC